MSGRLQKRLIPAVVTRREPEIGWRDYDRIAPGIYPAYCGWAKHYRDPGFGRWTCLLRFDVLSEDLIRTVARVPMWMNLGEREQPRAGRRSNYLKEWVRANGTPPTRRDRLSPTVFIRRIARVEIADTKGDIPYSKVLKILSWENGFGSLSQQVTQSRKA
jgi:hypothetical protein